MDDSELQVECPHCGAVFGVADGPAGRQATCPVCRGAVQVLEVQESPDASAPQGQPAVAPTEDYFAQRKKTGIPRRLKNWMKNRRSRRRGLRRKGRRSNP